MVFFIKVYTGFINCPPLGDSAGLRVPVRSVRDTPSVFCYITKLSLPKNVKAANLICRDVDVLENQSPF
jgi:hypothetical protein